MDKNPNYWQAGQPTYKGIRVTAYSGNEAQAAALVAGKIDWTGSVLPNIDQAVIAKNPNISYNPNPAALVTQMNLNLNTKPLDDVIVRKAMSMALNREQILQVAFNGKAYNVDVTGLSDVYKDWKVADPSSLGDWTTYNAAKANQMLDDAGYKKGADGMRTLPDGTPIKFKLTMVQGFTDWISAGEIMVQNWKDVGIAVETVMIDPGAFFGSVPMGDFQIALWFGYSSPTPYGQYMNMMGTATVAPAGAVHNGELQPLWQSRRGCSARRNGFHRRQSQADRSLPGSCRRSTRTSAPVSPAVERAGLGHFQQRELQQLAVPAEQLLPGLPARSSDSRAAHTHAGHHA